MKILHKSELKSWFWDFNSRICVFYCLTRSLRGINVELCSQEEHKYMRESQSNDQNISLMANLSGIASDLVVGMLDSGVGGRSEEQDMRPRKKKGMRM